MTFDELNKFDLGYNGFTDFEAGQQSKQAEIDVLQEAVNREREQATEYYTDFHCAIAERDALQKRIDLIVDLVHDQTTDYFLDNLIQDILKDGD